MPFQFNMLLEEAGIDPAAVRLLRHQPAVAGRSLLDIWRADRATFEAYQALQAVAQRASFARPCWASFIGTWDGRTLFVGLYEAGSPMPILEGFTAPISAVQHDAGTYDRYLTQRSDHLILYAGKVYVEWGGGASGKRAWAQRADAQNKPITELHLDAPDRPFPGLMALAVPLSSLADAPSG
ncbi:hypothetical protein [Sphingomonas nostoxanthinifaciens]|uniref:hypothetical protein n=1 Tax=Sphingomonas nostoxanthinifaciens TaxID=2872652 RepID=UPI001CC20550|nr:hypothetical protein [Sphingomonas nostoxanthinifaciens]UAK25502.1 hypothetical protein K8P63_04870 [Sphingomonas nostoxanthinifaciens]